MKNQKSLYFSSISYIGLSISYIGLSISYIGLSIFYIGLSIFYVGFFGMFLYRVLWYVLIFVHFYAFDLEIHVFWTRLLAWVIIYGINQRKCRLWSSFVLTTFEDFEIWQFDEITICGFGSLRVFTRHPNLIWDVSLIFWLTYAEEPNFIRWIRKIRCKMRREVNEDVDDHTTLSQF